MSAHKLKFSSARGLRATLIAWLRQIKYFGHDHGDRFTILVFDNRGVGDSDKPLMRYSTSEMAKDVVELVDYIGWKETKQLHIVGVSMGGMIAQELAFLIPGRVASLVLQSTAAAIITELPWLENVKRRLEMIKPKSLEQRLEVTRRTIFSQAYMDAPDRDGVFPTNADRFNAEELWKTENLNPPSFFGFLAQLIAAGWHNCGPERLEYIGKNISHILVLYGTDDIMIEPSHSKRLAEGLGPNVKVKEFTNVGHVISTESLDEYNELVRAIVEEAYIPKSAECVSLQRS